MRIVIQRERHIRKIWNVITTTLPLGPDLKMPQVNLLPVGVIGPLRGQINELPIVSKTFYTSRYR
jgi:hypothetical protein